MCAWYPKWDTLIQRTRGERQTCYESLNFPTGRSGLPLLHVQRTHLRGQTRKPIHHVLVALDPTERLFPGEILTGFGSMEHYFDR